MPTAGGPNTLGESNLVFAYDTGDTRNSYIGEPTTNQYTNPDFTNGTTGWTFGSWDGNVTYTTEAVTGPFGKTINALKLTKNATSAYSHFHQYNSGKYTTGNQYTLSAWVKGTGTFRGNTQWGGIVQSFTLTGDWQYVQYTVTAPNNDNFPYWAAEALTTGTVFYMVYAQSEQKSHATPFVNGTRSVTQGLLPLVGNSTLDLTNVSFDSNAQMVFDGTNDRIDLGSDITISQANQGWTAEYVFKTNSASTLQHFNSAEADDFNANWLAILGGKMAVWNVSPGYWKFGSTVFNSNQYYHIAFIQDAGGTNMRFYVNGVAEGGDHVGNVWTAAFSALKTRYIGQYEYAGSYSRYFTGEIPLTKMYNRALTAQEVKQNYQQYKTRFNLS